MLEIPFFTGDKLESSETQAYLSYCFVEAEVMSNKLAVKSQDLLHKHKFSQEFGAHTQ